MSSSHKKNDAPKGLLTTYGIALLRLSLGFVYVWFGVLKLLGKSPIADMVRDTAPPFLPKPIAVPIVGALEVTIGLGLLTRLALPVTMALFFVQMASTFLVLFRLPQRAFQHGNPLLLKKDGEFVIKNLVLLTAGIVVGSTADRPDDR